MPRRHLKHPKPQKFDLADYPAPIPPPLARGFFTLWDKGHTTYNIFANSCSPLASRPTTWDIWAFSRAGEPGRAQEQRSAPPPSALCPPSGSELQELPSEAQSTVQRLPDLWNSTAGSGCSFCSFVFFFEVFSPPNMKALTPCCFGREANLPDSRGTG